MKGAAQGLVRTNYRVRSATFALGLLVVGLHLWEHGAGPVAWALLVLQCLVYPHLLYWRATRSPRPVHAELDNLFLDAAALGAWCAALGFPTWISFALIGATTLNAVVNRGWAGLAWSVACTPPSSCSMPLTVSSSRCAAYSRRPISLSTASRSLSRRAANVAAEAGGLLGATAGVTAASGEASGRPQAPSRAPTHKYPANNVARMAPVTRLTAARTAISR